MDCIDKSTIDIFIDIKKVLSSNLPFSTRKMWKDYLLRIKYKIWGRKIKNSNKEYRALVFNRVYFWKNLLKNLIFFDKHLFLVKNGVIDVGCGAASSSIAIASLVSYKTDKQISISLVDQSKNQLSIARTFMNSMCYEIDSVHEGPFQIQEGNYNELVIFSYFFCEQYQEFLKLLYINRKKFTCGFVVIDYRKNIELIKDYFDINGDSNIEVSFLSYYLPDVLKDILHEKEVNVYGCYYQP